MEQQEKRKKYFQSQHRESIVTELNETWKGGVFRQVTELTESFPRKASSGPRLLRQKKIKDKWKSQERGGRKDVSFLTLTSLWHPGLYNLPGSFPTHTHSMAPKNNKGVAIGISTISGMDHSEHQVF